MTLVLSVVTLLLGPFIYALCNKHANARQFLDGFVFITIAGIVCVHIVPPALVTGGVLAAGFLVLGLAFPVVLEKVFDRAVHQAHRFIMLIAALGLVLHAVLDGVALLPLEENPSGRPPAALGASQLAWGVILHRLPIGMAVWWSLRPQFGAGVAAAIFAIIILATSLSYFLATPVVALAASENIAFFQAFIAGSLVHVVAFGVSHTHDTHVEPTPPSASWGYRLGILIGMFVVFALPQLHLP